MIDFSHHVPPCSSFAQLLRWRAELHPERALYTFLRDGEKDEETYSYADLDRRAKAVAGWLIRHRAEGQRVLLIFPQGLDFLAAFFGCLYAGAVAVPAYPPRANRKATRVSRVVADADAAFALTTSALRQQMEQTIAQDPQLTAIRWQSIDEIAADCAADWQEPLVTEHSTSLSPIHVRFDRRSQGRHRDARQPAAQSAVGSQIVSTAGVHRLGGLVAVASRHGSDRQRTASALHGWTSTSSCRRSTSCVVRFGGSR